mmetsp:Transcript_37264/g.66706  ORF Transcript_37264/g.66706 Transcript_37264/m.66706 type:complete len:214 (+) Transcript_37264:1927-2568(+)
MHSRCHRHCQQRPSIAWHPLPCQQCSRSSWLRLWGTSRHRLGSHGRQRVRSLAQHGRRQPLLSPSQRAQAVRACAQLRCSLLLKHTWTAAARARTNLLALKRSASRWPTGRSAPPPHDQCCSASTPVRQIWDQLQRRSGLSRCRCHACSSPQGGSSSWLLWRTVACRFLVWRADSCSPLSHSPDQLPSSESWGPAWRWWRAAPSVCGTFRSRR